MVFLLAAVTLPYSFSEAVMAFKTNSFLVLVLSSLAF
jgi:hypothetical protein